MKDRDSHRQSLNVTSLACEDFFMTDGIRLTLNEMCGSVYKVHYLLFASFLEICCFVLMSSILIKGL